MDLLRKAFGLREDQERLIIAPLLILIFLVIIFALRGCLPSRDASALTYGNVGNVLPAASAPIIKNRAENNVQFAGSYLPNDHVELFIDGQFVERVETDRLGRWTYETTMSDGRHDLRVTAQRDGGTIESSTYPFNVQRVGSVESDRSAVNYLPRIGESDTLNGLPIQDPLFGAGLDGVLVAAGSIALSGTSTPGSEVIVTTGDRTLGRVRVDDSGRWELNSNFTEPGSYPIEVRSVESPDRPIDTITLNIGRTLQRPTIELNPERSADRGIIRLQGTGEPNVDLGIFTNEQLSGVATTDADGNWFLDVAVAPEETSFEFVAVANDADALEPAISTPTRLQRGAAIVETEAEATGAAAITLDPLTLESADLDITNGLASGNIDLSGTGEPIGAQVVLFLNDTQLGDTTIDTSGQWNFTTELNLSPGTYQVSAELRDDDGSVLSTSETTTLIIPETLDEANDAVVTLADDGFNLDPATIADDGTASGTFELSGTVEPAGSTVFVYLDGEQVGEFNTDDGGAYSFSLDYELAPGNHELAMRIVDTNGAAIAESQTRIISIPEPANAAPAESSSLRVVFAGLGSGDDTGDDSGEGDEGDDIADAGLNSSTLPAVELIVDASWSMTLDMSGENRLTSDDPDSRIAIAREALNTLVDSLPDDLPIAVRGFGNRAAPLECQTALESPLQLLDREPLRTVLLGIEPQFNANTPIAMSLSQVAQDLANFGGQRRVVLLTDGEENCGGDPAAAIQQLRDSGINVTIDIVGFAIGDPALQAQFEAWAQLGGGTYYNADNAEDLADALQSAVVVPYRVLDTAGEEVATGIVGGAAIELPAGTYTVEILTNPVQTLEVEVDDMPTTLTLE